MEGDLTMKYKRQVHMEIHISWPFLSESLACFLTPLNWYFITPL